VRAVGLPLVPVEVQAATDVTKSPGSAPEPDTSGDTTTTAKGSDAAAIGPVPQPITVGCSAEGQAREVVAAWLAAQADPALAGRYRDVRLHGPAARDSYTGQAFTQYEMDEPAINAILWQELGWTQTFNMYGGGTIGGVEGSPTATDLAAQLLDMPPTQVATAIQVHWDEWTDPTTSIQAIIDAFDLEPPPTPAQWVERGDGDPADYTESIAAYPLWLGDAALLGNQSYPTCP
jgi:hypothetical protein